MPPEPDSAARAAFGHQLRGFRVAVGMTQEVLSERSGISVDAISALENGRRSHPRRYTVRALADALGLCPGDRERLASAAAGDAVADPVTGSCADETGLPVQSRAEPVRVAIVDDHPIARYGMERILVGSPGLRLVLSAAGVEDLSDLLKEDAALRADLVVMDLYLQGERPSLDVLRKLVAVSRVLVISASTRPADVLDSILAGASGYLTKRAVARTFVTAIEAVYSGGFWLSSELAGVLRSELGARTGERTPLAGASTSGPKAETSAEEDEILSCIASGLTHEQTALRMGISTTAVNLHLRMIHAKLRREVEGSPVNGYRIDQGS
ncbi:MAG: helix-turn-helix domain-containing protein [Streptosporangiaceae bacterium]|nr:helix-turn-helix domain-containing protein [Streptosporangiaceae bacterium]